MRIQLWSHGVAVFGCVTLAFSIATLVNQNTAAEEPAAITGATANKAAQLVQRALGAEAKGDADERADLIERALAIDPEYAPAHWQHGDVRVRDRWLPVDKAAQEIKASGKIEEYYRKRAGVRATLKDQVALADWCTAQGLDLQARMHLMGALSMQPESRSVISKLGLAYYQGKLVPAATLDQIKKQQKEQAAAERKWSNRLHKLLVEVNAERLKPNQAADRELREIVDPSAIPTMESLSTSGGPTFGVAIVAALSCMPEQEATDALVRQAIYSQYDDVRESAAAALKDRSLFAYVPTLMGLLQSPIEIQAEQAFGWDQSFHRLALFQEGPLASQALVSAGGYTRNVVVHKHPKRGGEEVDEQVHPDVTLAQDAALAQQAADFNVKAEAMNANVIAALVEATGQQAGEKPTDWWKWWLDYNEIYQYPVKPVQVSTRNYTPRRASSYRVTYSSCFVAGTTVWTITGPVPIDNVKEGDCVLSQSTATGELAYKPVLATTVRPASPVREIKTKAGVIRATRGHPFWVSGLGWRMVKELKPGDQLHTVDGPAEITSAEEAGDAVCYNLVVDDFGTYFVGEQKTLVHDNTIRDVTPAVVPGLVVK